MEAQRPATQQASGDPSAQSDFKIFPTFFELPIKITNSGQTWKGTDPLDFYHYLHDWINKSHSHSISAEELLRDLTKVRGQALFRLEQYDADLNQYSEYISMMVAILDQQVKQAPQVQKDIHVEESSSSGQQTFDVDKFSNAVSFSWREVLFPQRDAKVSYWGIPFEVSEMLLAIAMVAVRKVPGIVRRAGSSGLDTHDSQQVYQAYLDAGGICKYILDRYVDQLVACPAMDCQKQTIEALTNFFMAEAQHITVLRAIAKGNHPTLISSLASDTADLYSASETKLREIIHMQAEFQRKSYGGCGVQLAHYVGFNSQAMSAIAYSFNGLRLLNETKGGAAVKSCQIAEGIVNGNMQTSLKAYASAYTSVPESEYSEFVKVVKNAVMENLNTCKKDNDSVYFEKIPEEAPELAEPKRLIKVPFPIALAASEKVQPKVLEAFQTPSGWQKSKSRKRMEAAVIVQTKTETESTKKEQEEPKKEEEKEEQQQVSGCCLCFRWLVFLLIMPILLVLSLVGILVWIILLPVKIICCPVGCIIQLIWNVVEWLIKAPFRAVLWVTGKPWQPVQETKEDDRRTETENKV